MRIYLVFRSVCTTFDYVEGTFARKNPNKFGFSLAYSYLCRLKEEKVELNILNTIETPDDLRRLDVEQLPQLCDELRQFIVEYREFYL